MARSGCLLHPKSTVLLLFTPAGLSSRMMTWRRWMGWRAGWSLGGTQSGTTPCDGLGLGKAGGSGGGAGAARQQPKAAGTCRSSAAALGTRLPAAIRAYYPPLWLACLDTACNDRVWLRLEYKVPCLAHCRCRRSAALSIDTTRSARSGIPASPASVQAHAVPRALPRAASGLSARGDPPRAPHHSPKPPSLATTPEANRKRSRHSSTLLQPAQAAPALAPPPPTGTAAQPLPRQRPPWPA